MPATLQVGSESIVKFLRELADELEANRASITKFETNDWKSIGTRQLNISWKVDTQTGEAIS